MSCNCNKCSNHYINDCGNSCNNNCHTNIYSGCGCGCGCGCGVKAETDCSSRGCAAGVADSCGEVVSSCENKKKKCGICKLVNCFCKKGRCR